MRYSLRTLAIAFALLAALLGTWVQQRRTTMCQVRWLNPGSPEATALVPATVIEKRLQGWRVVYYPSHRGFQFLLKWSSQLPTPCLPVVGVRSVNGSALQDDQSLEFVTSDATLAATQVKALRQADVSRPGLFVIRGRVIDRDGKPLARAHVLMMGSYKFSSPFYTRSDGTFIMSLEDRGALPPAGDGYNLCVRSPDDKQLWQSSAFYFDASVPERDVIIVVPQ